eukprot:g2149.t1
MKFLRLFQSYTGTVYGLNQYGGVAEFHSEAIREFALFKNSAGDFEGCPIHAEIHPEPQPTFLVEDLVVSDDDSIALITGKDPDQHTMEFGILRLDRKLRTGISDEFLAPFYLHVPNVEVEIDCIKWFPGRCQAFCILTRNGVVSVYSAEHPSDPVRRFRIERSDAAEFGITAPISPRAVDLAFAECGPWTEFTLFVLYSDGAVFALNPVLPGGDCSDQILQAAAAQPVSRSFIEKLLIDVRSFSGGVPVLQGPINTGQDSEWSTNFNNRKSDRAVCLKTASCGNGVVTVTICTAHGKVFSHLLTQQINPKLITPPAAIISPTGERICSNITPLWALQLMEVVDIKTSPRRKENVTLFQSVTSPEVAYVDYASKIYHLQIKWITGSHSHSIVERFEQQMEWIGFFQDLNASISVFQNQDSMPVFISRPSCVRKSLMEATSGIPRSLTVAQVTKDITIDSEDSAFVQLKQAQAEFESLLPQQGDFETVVDPIEDTASILKDRISELESHFKSLNLLTSSSVHLCNDVIKISQQNEILESQLNSFASFLFFLNCTKRRLTHWLRSGSLYYPLVFEESSSVRLKSDSVANQSKPTTEGINEETKAQIETAKTVSRSFMFPWERRQMDGENAPLRTWEKFYWWVFVVGLAALFYSWSRDTVSTKSQPEVDEELEAKKIEMARAVLAGKSLNDGVDPFEGFTPRQIEKFVESTTGASTDDPFEGMTPEEINEYVAKHGN